MQRTLIHGCPSVGMEKGGRPAPPRSPVGWQDGSFSASYPPRWGGGEELKI